jgi:hypothetical protein
LTADEYLGYGRIHEIIDAVQGSSLAGGDWIKERIERMAIKADVVLPLSDGTANLMYQEMKRFVDLARGV